MKGFDKITQKLHKKVTLDSYELKVPKNTKAPKHQGDVYRCGVYLSKEISDKLLDIYTYYHKNGKRKNRSEIISDALELLYTELEL